MKPLLILFLATGVLSSCHSLSDPSNQAHLTPTAIYNIDSVRLATGSGDDKSARKQLLAAVNVYKNEKDPAKSVGLFKKSIQIRPSAEAIMAWEAHCSTRDNATKPCPRCVSPKNWNTSRWQM